MMKNAHPILVLALAAGLAGTASAQAPAARPENDIRIKMCIEPTAEDFVTVHHELGHNF